MKNRMKIMMEKEREKIVNKIKTSDRVLLLFTNFCLLYITFY